MAGSPPGSLYVVATPIGNLGDITYRAAAILREADFIAAEDTRVTRKLLSHLSIKKPLVSYYRHNMLESGKNILERIVAGENCALVSDAGTPAISDPGEELIRMCAEAGITTVAIPGPCAAIAALSVSGLPTGRFTFEGFLSTAKKSRFERLDELKSEKRTMVFFEAPHKLLRTLKDMLAVFGDRRTAILRELTKIHDETMRIRLSEAVAYFEATPPRGEFVLILEGVNHSASPPPSLELALAIADSYVARDISASDAIKKASAETGVPKNAVYEAYNSSHR